MNTRINQSKINVAVDVVALPLRDIIASVGERVAEVALNQLDER